MHYKRIECNNPQRKTPKKKSTSTMQKKSKRKTVELRSTRATKYTGKRNKQLNTILIKNEKGNVYKQLCYPRISN